MNHSTRLMVLVVATALAFAAGCSKKEPEVRAEAPDRTIETTQQAEPPQGPTWPFTGLTAPSTEAVTIRAVSIKIENSREARPQTNLQMADVVYETVTEGGITRFNAIYHSQAPESVGPVRSARLSDLDIVPQYHALFAFASANKKVRPLVEQSEIDSLGTSDGVTRPYRRSDKREAPHNLYTSIPALRTEGEARKMPAALTVEGLHYGDSNGLAGSPSLRVDIPFSAYNQVTWNYDEASGTYMRVNNGHPFMDEGTGKQVSAQNVVVMWAKHVPDIGQTYDIILAGGRGRATVFRDGRAYEGIWNAGTDAPPTFETKDGTQILLSPGNTWFQVIDVAVKITTS